VALVGVLLLLGLAAVEHAGVLRQRPSLPFVELDIDRDGEISREEWEARYGTSALINAVLEFDRGDCDRNGRLTWTEYFRVRHRLQKCEAGPVEVRLSQARRADLDAGALAPIVSARDVHLARVSLQRHRQRLIEAKFHEQYSERDLSPGEPYLHTVSCSGTEVLEILDFSQDFRQFSRLADLGPR